MNVLTVPVDLGGIWHYGWAVGLVGLSFIKLKEHRFLTCAWAFFIGYAVWIAEAPLLPFGDYTRAFQATAGQAAIEIALLVWAAIRLRKHIMLFATVITIIEQPLVWINHAGLMGWESFDCALIALCIPFVDRRMWVTTVTGIITILFHHASTAQLMLAAEMIAICPALTPVVLVPLSFVMYWHHHGPWLDGMERVHTWIRMMKFWATDWKNIAIGTGPGSFMWISCLVDNFKPPIFLQMHNDWLQILFEEGMLGLGIAITLFYRAVQRCAKRDDFRAGVLGAAAFALTYHPLRFFPSAFMIAMVFANAFFEEDVNV